MRSQPCKSRIVILNGRLLINLDIGKTLVTKFKVLDC